MQYTKAFFIKLALTIGMLLIVLGLFFNISIMDSIIIGIVLTFVAFVGDMIVLPKVGNMIAATGDLLLAFLVVWGMGSYLFDEGVSLLSAALLSSLFIGGGELYYHRYLRDHVFVNVDKPNNFSRVNHSHRLQMEVAEEFHDLQPKESDKK
ncbi:DUF2512 family protein [Ureibacillus manganicus]|uniref:Integral membrane protein n=1 Tax=Ureibacillus manganicus DSM 26584 TaxID=1384049 RepID=A0A0A3I2K4_9BACL|nr:DUF2512 family protein [Ureibacillus manganicus]KGR76868.1 hypothetical protein CD29_16115 [Ureibacillus manganicus DSM 26584]